MISPLAERLRPKTLEEFLGQAHLIGSQGVLRRMIESGLLPSIIFWGPSGSGKTTLAQLLAKAAEREFFSLSAIESGVKEVREVIEKAKKKNLFSGEKAPVLFIDEIHRFHKGQQDALLGAVEKGWIVLIGATTENPSFEVVGALLSRCQVYTLEGLSLDDMRDLIKRAIEKDEWLSKKSIEVQQDHALIQWAGGDARKLLNALELISNQGGEKIILNDENLKEVLQENVTIYDKNGEMHYDIISAFIKSIRGSDPNAAVYWLARMIEGGEDPKFIARRLLILAAEDIGLANPTALIMANATFEAVEKIGWPEGRIILSECAIYLATSPKSNSAYKAINKAQKEVTKTGDLPVPFSMRNAPTSLMKNLNYGKGYKYAHDFTDSFADMEFLPEKIKAHSFYKTGKNSREQIISDFLKKRWGDKYE